MLVQLPEAPAQSGQLSGVDAAGLGLGQDSGDMVGRIHAPILLLADATTFSAIGS
jgi:hypothetical protein